MFKNTQKERSKVLTMLFFNEERADLEEKSLWLRDYNRGLKPKPNFPTEVLRKIRRYQAGKMKDVQIFEVVAK
jgi:hypothetical protein